MDDTFYRQLGADVTYEADVKQQAAAIFARRMALAAAALGVDWNALAAFAGELRSREQREDNYCSVLFRYGGFLKNLRLSDARKLPGLVRGVQTWLLVGIPLGAAIAACELAAPPSTEFMFLGKPDRKNHPDAYS